MANFDSSDFVGGNLSLNFINTVSGRNSRPGAAFEDYTIRNEKLAGFEDIIIWCEQAGIINISAIKAITKEYHNRKEDAADVYKRIIALREALFRIYTSIINQRDPKKRDVEVINRELTEARLHEKLVHTPGKFKWEFAGNDLSRIIWPIVSSAGELLSSDKITNVRICPGGDCAWLFLDTSKNKSRQWCDMKACGNLAKVHRFRNKSNA